MNEETKKLLEEVQKGVAESVTPAITEQVFSKIMNELPNRKDIFGGGNTKHEEQESKEAAAEYLRKKVAGENTKSLSAGTATSGAELVPTYVSSEIVRVAESVGLVRKYARKWPMSGANENIPTADSLTAYRVAEGAKITSSQPTTGNVQLRGKTVGVIVPVTKKLLRNATAQTVDMINTLAGEAIAKLEDKWALLGLAASEGVFQASGVPGVVMGTGDTTYAKVDAEDLLDVIDKLDPSAINESTRWVLHLSVFNALRKLRSVVGSDKQGFLFQGFGAGTPPTIWDLPYSLSPVMPKTSDGSQNNKKFLGLVSFKDIIFGDSMNYSLEISDQATVTDTDGSTLINTFEQEMVALKVVGEIDIQLANPTKAFATLATANA